MEESDRCCLSIVTPVNGKAFVEEDKPDNKKDLIEYYTNPSWIFERAMKRFENSYFGGEAFPCIFPFFGTSGHSSYFKNACFEYAKDTVWFYPKIEATDEELLVFEHEGKNFTTQKRIMESLANLANGKCYVGMPDNCGSLDGLAQLRDSVALLVDMYFEPDEVLACTRKMILALKITGDELFAITKQCNDGGSCHGWMNTWSTGRHMQIQCDLSVMISPAMFGEFVLPELEETARWLDQAIYHLDGQEQIRHLDHLLSVEKINMFQWTPVAGQPKTSNFIDVLKKIQRRGKGLVLFPEIGEVEKIVSGLSPRGLHLIIRDGVSSRKEANELVRCVEKWSVKR